LDRISCSELHGLGARVLAFTLVIG